MILNEETLQYFSSTLRVSMKFEEQYVKYSLLQTYVRGPDPKF